MENDILKDIWPEWKIVKQIGRGSFGIVYEVVRYEHQIESHAAVKVISIPQSQSDVVLLRSKGLTEKDTKSYFEKIVDDFISEIQLMDSFKGIQNIVNIDDYKVVEKKSEIGWDIYIRMELLTPLNDYICGRRLLESDVIKLGCEICTALELCEKKNIIHLDIKPENIFVNSFGNFKLGDFGAARHLEYLTFGLSKKGTYSYMAPEVERGITYGSTADIYSLGLVLYGLLNKNRLPFLEANDKGLNLNEQKNAAFRRMQGEPFPPPCDASDDMSPIILCACSFDPRQRFSSAAAMKNALLHVGVEMDEEQNLSVANQSTNKTRYKIRRKKYIKVLYFFLSIIVLMSISTIIFCRYINDTSVLNMQFVNYKKKDRDTSEKIDAIVSKADILASNGQYENAIEQIQLGLNDFPESTVLEDKKEEYSSKIKSLEMEDILSQAESYKNIGDYISAIRLLNNARNEDAEIVEYQEEYMKYSNEYKENMKMNAEDFANIGDYDKAIDIINKVISVLGEMEDLNQKKQEYILEKETIITEKKESEDVNLNTNANANETNVSPFYGIWCFSSKSIIEAQEFAASAAKNGFNAQVFLTTDWSNLNSVPWYVVTAGIYFYKEEALSALPNVQLYYPDAYIKHSGNWQG